MKRLHIYQEPFDGTILNTMHDGIVDYTGPRTYTTKGTMSITSFEQGLTLSQYIREEGLTNIKTADDNAMDKLMAQYAKSLCTDWKEITERDFDYALDCLPPLRYNGGFFFMREELYAGIYTCYAKFGKKFYMSDRFLSESSHSIRKSLVSL